MTLPRFLDACYALLVEEHQRIDPFKDFLSMQEKLLPSDAKVERAPARRDVKAQNDQAMMMLKSMMGGVKGSPV